MWQTASFRMRTCWPSGPETDKWLSRPVHELLLAECKLTEADCFFQPRRLLIMRRQVKLPNAEQAFVDLATHRGYECLFPAFGSFT